MIFNINSTRGHTGSLLVKYYNIITEMHGKLYLDGLPLLWASNHEVV